MVEHQPVVWGLIVGVLTVVFFLARRAWRDARPYSDDVIRRIFHEVDEEN
jgi:hypothetical protein